MPNTTSVNFPKSGQCHCKDKYWEMCLGGALGCQYSSCMQRKQHCRTVRYSLSQLELSVPVLLPSLLFHRKQLIPTSSDHFQEGDPDNPPYDQPLCTIFIHSKEETSPKHKSQLLTSTGCVEIPLQNFQKTSCSISRLQEMQSCEFLFSTPSSQ